MRYVTANVLWFVTALLLVQPGLGQSGLGPSRLMAQSFDLIEPSGVVTGRIAIDSGYLTYWDQSGERVTYVRDRGYDTPNGQFVGYYNTPLARVLKFPRSGRGRFLYADLDDLIPTDAFSTRTIRRTGSRQVYLSPPVFGNSIHGNPGIGALPGTSLVPTPIFPSVGPLGQNANSPLRPLGLPQSTLLQSRSVPLPDLPPATVTLFNGGNREIEVTMTDRRNPGAAQSLRIKPQQSQAVTLHRDAGERLIQTFQVVSPLGDIVTDERTQDVPPPVRYELTVHQWRLQSIAIDRTQGGNNAIEDINVQGQAVGKFVLPPGPRLTSGTIDAFRAARAMGNQGAIGPLVPQEDWSDGQSAADRVSPLERAVMGLGN